MSSRYLREPQSSSLRSRLFLENKGEASNTVNDRRSVPPIVQTPLELRNENPGLPVNGYVTSGLRGRSAIYRMSRSPYFKVGIYLVTLCLVLAVGSFLISVVLHCKSISKRGPKQGCILKYGAQGHKMPSNSGPI